MKINIHTSHPSAFISSTFLDLEQERNAVAKALKDSNLNINALDIKPASNDSARKEILSGITESDFIILIIGERYGAIIPRMTGSSKLSITRWEYIRAVKSHGKHVLVYFKNVESKDLIYYDDYQSADFDMKRKLLAEFKKELSDTHKPDYFTTAEELAEKVRKAIIPTYRAGVKSLIKEKELLIKKVEALELDNQKLKNSTKSGSIEISNPTVNGLHGLSDIRSAPKGLLELARSMQKTDN